MNEIPPPPEPIEPNPDWEHRDLWIAVREAIYTLPSRFESELVISGVLATDLFSFNSSLGATIEEQVIASLNRLGTVWDPDQKYALYSFERQPQTFPDVVLRTSKDGSAPDVLMGIELKGWYALAKESEPSFRYKVTPAVCAPADLLVVVPWTLSKVISGSPQVFKPFVIGARQAAEYRNWYWRHKRGGSGNRDIESSNRDIESSNVDTYYPTKSEMISDRPVSDSGGNFGRFARTKVMEDYINSLFDEKLSGIPLWAWQRFLALFTESQTPSDVRRGLEGIENSLVKTSLSPENREMVILKLREIGEIITSDI
ncbi:MAG: hypothetical protein RID91_21645 [Azospirillaceae bacterium]